MEFFDDIWGRGSSGRWEDHWGNWPFDRIQNMSVERRNLRNRTECENIENVVAHKKNKLTSSIVLHV